MKKALVVAYHFPPVGGVGAAGSQRMHKFAKHLPSFGWDPTVLTLKESSYESYLKIDPTLMKDVSPKLPIVRTGVLRLLAPLLVLKSKILRRDAGTDNSLEDAPTGAADPREKETSSFQNFKDSITDLFETPDDQSGWIIPGVFAGARAIRKQDISAIIATGRPWTTLVIGAVLKRLTGRMLVIDFRDPWMTNPFRLPYTAVKNRAERWLEDWVIRSADLVVANTDTLRDEFIERFGDVMEEKCITVLNGFDADEFSTVEPESRSDATSGAFLMVHPGVLYGKRDPRILLEAVAEFRKKAAVSGEQFHCEFIGSVSLPYDLQAVIDDLGLTGSVTLRGPVSYAESLSALAACDAALLLQPGTNTQIPSKLFEYIGFGKKMLAVAPLQSSVAEIVTQNDLGIVADCEDLSAIADGIQSLYAEWLANNRALNITPASQENFDVRRAVGKLSDAMTSLVASSA